MSVKWGDVVKKKHIKISKVKESSVKDTTVCERPCTIQESIVESFKEVKLMQEGLLPRKTFNEFLIERSNGGKHI